MADGTGLPLPYFKVEGLAVLPGNRLVFGIRERGTSFKDFQYTMTLIEATYHVDNGRVVVDTPMRQIYRFDPSSVAGIPEGTGLSSLYFDRKHHRLFVLTSFEKEELPTGLGDICGF